MATTNFGRSDVLHLMLSLDSRVVSRLSHNNRNTIASPTFLVPNLHESYRTVIITNLTTTVSQNSNTLCT